MAWTTLKGFLFRDTSGYVTNPANSIFVGDGGFGAAPAYLTNTTIDGDSVDYGYTAGYVDTQRDRDDAIDARLAGLHQAPNTDTTGNVWRLNLPQAGTYEITLALGDANNGQRQYWRILDNTTVLETNDKTGTLQAGGNFYDTSGTNHTTPANWVANQVPKQYTFASQILFIEWGGKNTSASTEANSTLAYFGIRLISGGGGSNANLLVGKFGALLKGKLS